PASNACADRRRPHQPATTAPASEDCTGQRRQGDQIVRTRIFVLAAVALAAAGCSPSRAPAGTTSTAPATVRSQALPVWPDFVACVRSHGLPAIPDPQVDDRGEADFPNFHPRTIPHEARQCERILDRLPASAQKGGNHPDLTAAQLETLRRFATCMR